MKFAQDVTPSKLLATETAGKLEAISRSQAVIEFDMQGNILTANANFLRTLGYTPAEVEGKHHSMFCSEAVFKSPDYRHFWADLGEGKFKSGRFHRMGKHGAEVWIQSTYNPILNIDGKPFKVVKFAMDITEQVQREQLVKDKVKAITEVLEELSNSIGSISSGSEKSTQWRGRRSRKPKTEIVCSANRATRLLKFRSRHKTSTKSSTPSATLRARPTCWHSMPPSRLQGPVNTDWVSQWWQTRCASWPKNRPKQPAKLPPSSTKPSSV